MPIVLKCGSLNLLEPSGPVQACNGIALPLPLPLPLPFTTCLYNAFVLLTKASTWNKRKCKDVIGKHMKLRK